MDDYCYVQAGVTIGSRTLLTHRAQVCSGAVIGDDCVIGGFVGDNAAIGNGVRMFGKIVHLQHDPCAEWDADQSKEGAASLEDGCFVGFDAKVIGPVRIGAGAYVAANAIVTRDIPGDHVVLGVNKVVSALDWQGRLKLPFWRTS